MKETAEIIEMAKKMTDENQTEVTEALSHLFVSLAERLYDAGYRKQSEWISVEERLPDLYGTYLVYTHDNRIKLGYFCELVIGLPPSFDDFAVTHWMPLPEPPKGAFDERRKAD